jgi:hypothetical protein
MRGLKTRPPYTVVAYAAFVAITLLVALVREGAQGRWVGGGLLLLIATLGLVWGVWLSWLFLTALAAGDVIIGLVKWPEWPWSWILVINGFMLVLLLAGPTRRYTSRGRPRLLERLG